MGDARRGAGAVICAAFFVCSMGSAASASEPALVSVSCDRLQRVGDTIRVNQDTIAVDDNWDGYSLRAGQKLAGASTANGEKKLFTMIVGACKF